LAFYYYSSSIGLSLFLILFGLFFVPRFAFLFLSTISRRIVFDASAGSLVETFGFKSVVDVFFGIGESSADREVHLDFFLILQHMSKSF
jgi:hypothetical protein